MAVSTTFLEISGKLDKIEIRSFFAEKHFHHFLVEKYLMLAPNSKIMLQLIKEISLFVSKHRKLFKRIYDFNQLKLNLNSFRVSNLLPIVKLVTEILMSCQLTEQKHLCTP